MAAYPASYGLHGCSPKAAYLRGCLMSADGAERIAADERAKEGYTRYFIRIRQTAEHNRAEARRVARELIGAGC